MPLNFECLNFKFVTELCFQCSGGVVVERLGVFCDPSSTSTLPIISRGIQLKGEYEWRRFVLGGRRGFTNYSTVVPSGGWSGFRASGRAKGLAAVD
ncbi:hypothetical protein HanHA300_Chr11g0410071 [Helianthus annuus]|nr:hypothetical protein HanHA300_Chr11g0410071 [Helianthus annuus]KAJ0518121.1 hypothetical protein HanHA89_Chr11g0433761 [Helianthus annuus]KAJ0686146.1 hypothetical protein HanLR1_Chr11g0411351 [Helianthus annuus]KAJ0689988.1 hypothetical protein HanOQP8_Chr11g0412661 [Helianthus annuus]